MSWSAFLFQTTTGQIGPQIQIEDQRWSISLNETEEASFSLRKSDLPAVDFTYWLAPWWAGVVILWNDTPVFAGPIVSRPTESFEYIRLECRGIRAILAKHLVVEEQTDWSKLAKTKVTYSNWSLGTIAKLVVQKSMMKPGGYLPIEFPIDNQVANHVRNYQGYNIGNINCDEILTKLSNVSRGPDIMFKPRLVNDSKLVWDMWYGSERQPRIYQNNVPIWDTTTVDGEVSDMDMVVTGSYQTFRVFGSGAGMDAGTMIRARDNEWYLSKGYPMLETTTAHSSIKTVNHLHSVIQGNLDSNLKALFEIQLTVRGDRINPVGSFWPGDDAQLVIENMVALKNGTHKVRILNVNGDDSASVRVSVQTED